MSYSHGRKFALETGDCPVEVLGETEMCNGCPEHCPLESDDQSDEEE